jgi:hypothetical protein
MDAVTFKIARDFSPTPGPRYIHEGINSGELLRTSKFFDLFSNAIKENKKVIIDLDGTAGYGTSFLEEIFGGLIREQHLDYNEIIKRLTIISTEEPYLKDDIFHYLSDAHQKALVNS